MLKDIAHVSFDLDGTLVHTRPEYRHELVPSVVRQLGGVTDPLSVDEFWFKPNRSKTIREKFGLDPEVFWDAFGKADTSQKRDSFTHVYSDVIPFLVRLVEMGKTISIITGAPNWIAEMEIAKIEGVSFHSILALNGSGFSEKPCPDGMYDVLHRLNHLPEETLYIGNGLEDAMFASSAGCHFIYIDRGEHECIPNADFKIIRTLDDLLIET
jgi:FMN phosphatase YigB (HAD superfamily)